MQYLVEDLEGVQALDYNLRPLAIAGYAVQSGCQVSIDSGTLGGGQNAISVASGEALVGGGTSVSVNMQSIDVPGSDPDNPRRDVVYLDDSGDPNVWTGNPEPADPSGATGVDARRPAPYHFAGREGVPLAEIWVAAGVDTIGSDDLTDRRTSADTYTDVDAIDAVESHADALAADISGTAAALGGEPASNWLRKDIAQTFSGDRFRIESAKDDKFKLVSADAVVGQGDLWNYMEFEDSEGTRMGYFGTDADGNFQFMPEVSGADTRVGTDTIYHENNASDLKNREVNIGMTEIDDGQIAIGAQFAVPSGRTIAVQDVGTQALDQTTPSGLNIVVRDLTNSTDIVSQNTAFASGSPIASKSGAIDVRIGVENNTGGPVDASGHVNFTMT